MAMVTKHEEMLGMGQSVNELLRKLLQPAGVVGHHQRQEESDDMSWFMNAVQKSAGPSPIGKLNALPGLSMSNGNEILSPVSTTSLISSTTVNNNSSCTSNGSSSSSSTNKPDTTTSLNQFEQGIQEIKDAYEKLRGTVKTVLLSHVLKGEKKKQLLNVLSENSRKTIDMVYEMVSTEQFAVESLQTLQGKRKLVKLEQQPEAEKENTENGAPLCKVPRLDPALSCGKVEITVQPETVFYKDERCSNYYLFVPFVVTGLNHERVQKALGSTTTKVPIALTIYRVQGDIIQEAITDAKSVGFATVGDGNPPMFDVRKGSGIIRFCFDRGFKLTILKPKFCIEISLVGLEGLIEPAISTPFQVLSKRKHGRKSDREPEQELRSTIEALAINRNDEIADALRTNPSTPLPSPFHLSLKTQPYRDMFVKVPDFQPLKTFRGRNRAKANNSETSTTGPNDSKNETVVASIIANDDDNNNNNNLNEEEEEDDDDTGEE